MKKEVMSDFREKKVPFWASVDFQATFVLLFMFGLAIIHLIAISK